ncbi:hypothetical protein ScPMuIL_009351 [Solemya velum]
MPNSNAGDDMETDKFKAKNWKKVPDKTFKKMAPQEKSRYMAYEEPPKQVLEAQQNSRKRLVDESKRLMRSNPAASEEELVEKDKHEKLIGQLKAAEARNRLRIMRLRYQSNKSQEISHLIACQPSALKSVRLQALVPSSFEKKGRKDSLDKMERELVEKLLEDAQGLMTNRIH